MYKLSISTLTLLLLVALLVVHIKCTTTTITPTSNKKGLHAAANQPMQQSPVTDDKTRIPMPKFIPQEFRNFTRSILVNPKLVQQSVLSPNQPVWIQFNATNEVMEQHKLFRDLNIKLNFVRDTNLLYIPAYADFFTWKKISQKFDFVNVDLNDDLEFHLVSTLAIQEEQGEDLRYVLIAYISEMIDNMIMTVC